MEKAWLNRYPSDVPEFIDASQYDSILDIVEQSCKKHADSIAFLNMGATLTFRQLEEQSRAFAAYLQHDLKMQPGDRCAIMMPNLLQYPIALFGILRAGLIAVNVNPLYTQRELQHQLADSGTKMIVAITNFGANLEKVLPQTSIKHVIMTSVGDQLPQPKRTLVNFAIKYVKKMIPNFHISNAISMRKVIATGRKRSYRRPACKPEDIAYLQYTGGTTGVAKGAMLTHRNIVANVLQVFGQFSPRTLLSNDHVVTPLPLYHIFANSVSLMFIMMIGGRNLLITNPRDMDSFVKELKDYPFTTFFGLNTLFNAMLKNEKFRALDFSSCRFTIAGGMSTQEDVAKEWQKVTGMPIIEGYGLTECSPVVCSGIHTQQEYTAGIGVPLPSTEMRVVNDDKQPLGVDEVGELQVRGPQVMAGYWKQEEATSQSIDSDGWFSTGDIARMDKDGAFFIVDRKKDMILVSGFNVYPAEIEEVLRLHPDIEEAAAVGIPHQITGEQIKVFICSTNKTLTSKDIQTFCRRYLTAYKIPRKIEFRDTLPKSAVGKILKRELITVLKD
ncbi:AMP-binding protein [Moritella viscosa]|uniref:Long-chain-fatty-acid--CoA ligase n=1 Tax=Moritella viscosa TaxID=80854 RepID=A0A1L0B224_9GAMM|nr:AMP-binding protein [Moritella viscosa]SGY87280.1 Tyrocidine synthase 3-Tyrocidine synthase III-ATP-dependent asparagine adenylase-Asparagine activase-ATP-dependent glutamine adenylase-Glutamine activase-ATP-dependent tyrosine adenylase-Tyrosine activase-ATP-dependent valine adenylase-Valine activase-ATP-dependent ornithine adenylase-Ornithine activase-ATP-dependent leucine adenylase-Leucine activase [Moritella viscosa]SGY90339.1 Tyrocidine synthase 3-Tyrocidine synthase III-ATP-dependent aspa